MFGRKQNIFRSRWRAVWWSMGVLLTAYCAVPSPDEDELAQQHAAEAAQQHHNPWAIDPAKR